MSTPEITYEVQEELGVLSVNPRTNWRKLCRRVAWNSNSGRIEVRDWSPASDKSDGSSGSSGSDEPERMSRGISLSDEEAKTLGEILYNYFHKE